MNSLPKIKKIKDIHIPQVSYISIEKIPLYYIVDTKLDLISGYFIFDAGLKQVKKNLHSVLIGLMVAKGGTKNYNAYKISELLDYYGATLNVSITPYNAIFSFSVLKRNFSDFSNLFIEIINNSTFPDDEFEVRVKQLKAKQIERLQDTKYIASKKFTKELLKGTPYGNVIELKDFARIDKGQLFNCYKRLYTKDFLRMYLAGNIDDKIFRILENFNQIKSSNFNFEPLNSFKVKNKKRKFFIKIDSAKQTSLRIGKIVPNNLHPDFHKLAVVIHLLGGTFNSRLMQRLREKEGLTYGVYAHLTSFPELSFLTITAEVNSEEKQKAIDIIYEEIEKLTKIPVTRKELNTCFYDVVNEYLTYYDNPYSTIDTFKSLKELGLQENFYKEFIETFKKIKPEEIIDIANKYLTNDFLEVVVGNE
ncbi:MAG: insulinase family protein [Bacteroidales bacterium]|nr:insulinase family protein [Bacteroidales bacterium]